MSIFNRLLLFLFLPWFVAFVFGLFSMEKDAILWGGLIGFLIGTHIGLTGRWPFQRSGERGGCLNIIFRKERENMGHSHRDEHPTEAQVKAAQIISNAVSNKNYNFANGQSLLPCPFCGGEAHLQDDDEYHTIFVGCNNCDANGPPVDFHKGEPDRKATELWNRRK